MCIDQGVGTDYSSDNIGNRRYISDESWVQFSESVGTRGYRSENVGYCGYGLENDWVQIREWVQIRAWVQITDQRT